MVKILVTGGSGFIGSELIRQYIHETDFNIFNIDTLSYASHPDALSAVESNPRYNFFQHNICDYFTLSAVITKIQPDAVIHLAAESHVDRSINDATSFIHTNILGTYMLLEACRHYLAQSPNPAFRFLHVSTDEVFGSLGTEGTFNEASPYQPNSPYSASKASSDHLVRAWSQTYGIPAIVTHSCNNYGPYQHDEKFIPTVIRSALHKRPIPIYGDGSNIRDWLFVKDHAKALRFILSKGKIGDSYLIGANKERSNLEVAKRICRILDSLHPLEGEQHATFISFVEDRSGHDWRYAIDNRKIRTELGWQPETSFTHGLIQTVEWYYNQFFAGSSHDRSAKERESVPAYA